MKNKKALIIVIIIIAILCIGGGIFAYLFIATDTFRSDKELFAKYISQNTEKLQMLVDSHTIKTYKNLQTEDKYESNTNIKMTYSEGGEVSNPINNLAAKLETQKDADSKYFYTDGQILFNDEEYLESEIIKDKEIYGIRFSDVARQFVSVKDDDNLEKVASDIGTDTATLQKLIDIIDGTQDIADELINQNDRESLKEKYTNMVIETIFNGTFSSNRKCMITYNNNTVKVKAYTVALSSEQVENLIIQILNSLKTETAITKNIENTSFEEKIDEEIRVISEEKEVPAIKITVYEQKSKTIRTVVETGEYKIVLENSEENGQLKSNILINKVTADQTDEYDVELTKEKSENEEVVDILVEAKKGEENYTLSFQTKFNLTDEDINLDVIASYKKDIVTISAKFNNTVVLNNDFDNKVNLEETNNVVLNDTDDERRKNIIEALKSNVPVKVERRLELLKGALEIEKEKTDEEIPDYEMSQTDINKFNAKFEFFTGDEVSADNVRTLLETVGDNLGSYDIKLADNQENTSQISEDKLRYTIRLNIERNKKDENGKNKVLEKISDKKKYKVTIKYKGENQLIDYIMIEEPEK